MTLVETEWRVLPFTVATAAEQLKRSESLWRAVASGGELQTLRWYSYSAPAVVLGVGQPPSIMDEAACARAGMAVVKRTSGGAAVLADERLLALDVAIPDHLPLAGRDVVRAYRWLGEVWREALNALSPAASMSLSLVGAEAARADQVAQRCAPAGTAAWARGWACFGTLSPSEVVLAQGEAWQRKVVGLSQIRKRGVVVFQVGLYTSTDGHALARLLALPAPEREALGEELHRRTAGLDDIGISPDRLPELRRLVTDGIRLASASDVAKAVWPRS
ncbi:MAG: ligase [Chloroflexota bacterium]|nr:ligase [Chloroflexota bacterium]